MRNIVPFVLICLLIIYAINVYELFLTYYNNSHDDNINQCRNLYTDSYDHEKNNLIFLKTHKTASSTVTRILWRQLCDVDNRYKELLLYIISLIINKIGDVSYHLPAMLVEYGISMMRMTSVSYMRKFHMKCGCTMLITLISS